MTSNPHVDRAERSDDRAAREVEAYEDGEHVVLFDSDNPLAWVEANRTVKLRDAA